MTSSLTRPARPAAARARTDTAATRHLCAGVYLDRAYRDLVIRKVHNDPRHRVAPSAGFDLVAVVWHAWRARLLDDAEHLCLLLILAIGYAVNHAAGFTAACLLGLWHLVPFAVRTVPRVTALKAQAATCDLLRKRRDHRDDRELREKGRQLALIGWSCVVLVIALAVFDGGRGITLREVLLPTALLLAVMAAVAIAAGAARQWRLNQMPTAATLRPTRLNRRLAVIDNQQSHAYVVYRRHGRTPEEDDLDVPFPLPISPDEQPYFVGSGELLHRWLPPLVIQLLRDTPGHSSLVEREYTEPPFSAHELVAHLREAVERIRDADGDIRLPGLEVGDRLYIAETEVLTNREYLRAAISPQVLEDIIDHPGGPADHFLEVRVTTTGELVTTVLLRSTVKGRCLSLDFAACALTRTPAGYHLLDHYAETGTGAVVRSALCALAGLPAETGRSWRLALAPWLLACALWARKDATMIPRRRIWIGTQLSVRKEEDSAPWQHAYADEPKILDHMKIIEQCLISAAEDFLRAHHVDVSAFSKRAETIISANVLNLGGRMDIRNSAFGYQPQANFGSADRGEPPQEGNRS
jgi:hypothetical protein